MPPVPPFDDLWTVKDAAKYLKVCTKTIYELARIPESKGGPPIKRPLDLAIPLRPERKRRKKKRAAIRFPRERFIAWVNRESTSCSA